jgi:hypothetical protein
MLRGLALAAAVAVVLAACAPRSRLNADCRWSGDTSTPLDLTRAADRRELTDDVALAEDLAIRFADRTRGLRSGHYASLDVYNDTREQCFATLVADIGHQHGVEPDALLALRGRRPLAVDIAVGLSFAVLYLLLSALLAERLVKRFPADELAPSVVASGLVAVVTAVGAMLAMPVWAGAIEVVRLDNVHLSYRAFQLPWSEHRLAVFLAGLLLFLAVAGARYRREERRPAGATGD